MPLLLENGMLLPVLEIHPLDVSGVHGLVEGLLELFGILHCFSQSSIGRHFLNDTLDLGKERARDVSHSFLSFLFDFDPVLGLLPKVVRMLDHDFFG
jgi:hypothetical protein